MKKILSGFALALALSGAAFAGEKNETLKIAGWHCGGCAARTEAALKDVKGVTAVSSDKVKKEVTVTYDDTKASRGDIEKAIADSGFSIAK